MVNDCLNYLSSEIKNLSIVIATIAIGLGNSHPTRAQITPDASLEEESSIVTPTVEVKGDRADRIDGGAIRDRNLFHSFSEFNVNQAQRVYFANPNNIEQIFTRVTGNNPSNINGTLGVDGAADLLLLNPNGIIFGENSSLDVEGSFFGTSADSVLFEDETEFSAVQPSSLLTISVPVGLQMGNNPGSISVRSPLEMTDGQNFSLVGGEINLTGNNINAEDGVNSAADGIIAPGGKVELGGLSAAGIINFQDNSNLLFPESISKANINLNNYFINASAGGGGSIGLQSQNLRITDSFIITGINSNAELTNAQAGNIVINTDEATILEATDNSQSAIFNTTGENITGDLSELGLNTEVGNFNAVNVIGNAGNILINTNTLLVTGSSIIFSATNGEGNAGKIDINAKESISLSSLQPLDFSNFSNFTGILSEVGELGTGNGADINISTKTLSAKNVYISTSTIGAGNGGNIFMNVDDAVVIDNTSVIAEVFSTGDGANIEINTRSLLADSTTISTSTGGAGNAGNTLINAIDSIDFSNTTVAAATLSSGNAGNIVFESKTTDISLENSSITTIVLPPIEEFVGTGRGGDITINGSTLFTTSSAVEGGIISTGTGGEVTAEGLANSGNLRLNISDSVTISGRSGLSTNTIGEGNAGNLFINTKNLTLLQEGQINAGTTNVGNGGNITIKADEIKLSGDLDSERNNGIGATTQGTGNGGTIDITASNLSIENNAGGISVRSVGDGNAGSISAKIDGSLELDNGAISSRSDRSSGGEIEIAAGDIRLKGDSNIRTSVENGAGGGGNIILTADSIVAFDDSDIFSFSADGVGGNITLNTNTFFGANYTSAALNANPQVLDNNSRVDINATGFISGFVELPEIKFLPNSLVELSEDTLDADEIVANSCVVRSDRAGGTFIVTGSGGLPSRPGDAAIVDYSTGDVRAISDEKPKTTSDNWQPGDPIVEPDKAYRLSNGKLVLSRQCN